MDALAGWLFLLSLNNLDLVKFDGRDSHLLSPGEKGIGLLLLCLEAAAARAEWSRTIFGSSAFKELEPIRNLRPQPS